MSRPRAEVEDGEWEIAESRSSRKNKKRKIRHDNDDGPPELSFLNEAPEMIPVKSLQELILYVIAGGIAPSWLAIKNARRIEKVVVLMIPGLDREMLDSDILKSFRPDADGTSGSVSNRKTDSTPAEAQVVDDSSTKNARSIPQPKRYILSVRGPGDSHGCRVHSPLQAMLIAPDSIEKGSRKSEKSSQAVRTPVTTFVHTAEELREADYPVHPALFTNQIDAQAEASRRSKASQSSASGWVDTSVSSSTPETPATSAGKHDEHLTRGFTVYALDCEMVLTSDEAYSLARVSLVDWSGRTIMDRYVKPGLPISNYFTQYSGITPDILKDVTTTLADVQSELLGILTPSTILLGHSLESDLSALKLTHPFIVDTSMIYPHPRGFPLRSSLKYLANRYLKREIQKGGANGHDSVEDAHAVLDLVKLKCEKGPKWGTSDANGESLFRKVNRATRRSGNGSKDEHRTTAIVEYGTPEKGLGREATFAIGCETDEDVVAGVIRAARGDTTTPDETKSELDISPSKKIPPGGVDLIWSRLRALEATRGWNTLPPSDSNTPAEPEPSILDHVKAMTLTHLARIFDSLPRSTLFIMYTGTSDMRPFLRLQQQHNDFKREFKVKKWDELSVKWTDVEQQALGRAAEEARKGWAMLSIR